MVVACAFVHQAAYGGRCKGACCRFAEDLGWANNGENYNKIRNIISRLQATGVLIKNKLTYGDLSKFPLNGQQKKKCSEKIAAVTYPIRLIADYAEYEKIDGMPTKYLISLDKRLIFLFAGGLFSYLHWEDYKKLTPTGRRLTDYILSHKEPLPLAVQSFLRMCGADTAEQPAFRQNAAAKTVCAELVKKGIVKSAEVKDGFIYIERFDRSPLPTLFDNVVEQQ